MNSSPQSSPLPVVNPWHTAHAEACAPLLAAAIEPHSSQIPVDAPPAALAEMAMAMLWAAVFAILAHPLVIWLRAPSLCVIADDGEAVPHAELRDPRIASRRRRADDRGRARRVPRAWARVGSLVLVSCDSGRTWHPCIVFENETETLCVLVAPPNPGIP